MYCEEEKDMAMVIDDGKKITAISNIRNIIQKSIKEKNLSEEQIRKSFGIKRYEKK